MPACCFVFSPCKSNTKRLLFFCFFLSISGDRVARMDGTSGAALALHSCANAPPLGKRRAESWGQRAHHQRTERRCRGMFKHSRTNYSRAQLLLEYWQVKVKYCDDHSFLRRLRFYKNRSSQRIALAIIKILMLFKWRKKSL